MFDSQWSGHDKSYSPQNIIFQDLTLMLRMLRVPHLPPKTKKLDLEEARLIVFAKQLEFLE